MNACNVNTVLNALLERLPRYSEEGSDASTLNQQTAIAELVVQFGSEHTAMIQTTLAVVENLLLTVALLEPNEYSRGEWKFVSHSAQLCALSLLHTLADPQQRLFPMNFWHTAGVGDDEKLQQKAVLQTLEQRRQQYHLCKAALPIRFVSVAWSIIKLEQKILLHRREAKEHCYEYGLIGGRVNIADLRSLLGEQTPTAELLAILQAADSNAMEQVLPITLNRECREEIGLIGTRHYTPTLWRDLKPWQECMGGAPNYALTRYCFRLYHLQLTTSGYLMLSKRLKTPDANLMLCTMDECALGKTLDGAKTLTLDALYADFANDRAAVRHALQELAPSYMNRYVCTQEKDALICSLTESVMRGAAGKERPLPFPLSAAEKNLLMALAAHAKGFPIYSLEASCLTWHDHGWLEIHDAILETQFRQLSERFRAAELPYIELIEQCYCRLSVPPELIFFDPMNFSVMLQQQNKTTWQLTLHRAAIETPLGEIASAVKKLDLESSLGWQLQQVIGTDLSVFADEHLPKKVRSALKDAYQTFGLRQLLVTKDKFFRLAIKTSASQ